MEIVKPMRNYAAIHAANYAETSVNSISLSFSKVVKNAAVAITYSGKKINNHKKSDHPFKYKNKI